jgi:hypothetical protein
MLPVLPRKIGDGIMNRKNKPYSVHKDTGRSTPKFPRPTAQGERM